MTFVDLAKARAARIHRGRSAAQMLGYAVLDVETTGLRPGGHDRIVEIAIVRLDPQRRAPPCLAMPAVRRSPVPEEGVEPSWAFARGILRPLSKPFLHSGVTTF